MALNTKATRKLVDEFGIVPLVADRTEDFPEADRLLERFSPALSMPTVVIFPGNNPKKVIVLRDYFSEATLLESLRKAGPSAAEEKQASRPAGQVE